MCAWSPAPVAAVFSTPEGELIQIRVSTEPWHLESVLDCLASLSFPINPQIYHGIPTVVEFPGYLNQVPDIRKSFEENGLDPATIQTSSMLEAIRAA